MSVCVSVCLCVRTHKYTTFRGQSLRVRRGFQRTNASQTALNTTQLVVQLLSPVDVCGRSDLRQTVSINALLVRGVLSNKISFWRSRPPPPKHLRSSPRCTASCTNQPRPQLRYTSRDACAFAAAEARLDPHFSVLTEGGVCCCVLCACCGFFGFFSTWTTFWQPPRKDFQVSTSLQPAVTPIYISQRVFALSFWAARVRVRGMLSILRNACVFHLFMRALLAKQEGARSPKKRGTPPAARGRAHMTASRLSPSIWVAY